MDEGYVKLMSLRMSAVEYRTFCSHYSDTPEEKERWMLHYDVITLLCDDEKYLNLETERDENRFINLESMDQQVAISYQNTIRKKFSLNQVYSCGDILDLSNGDLIEVKVTYVPEFGETDYLAQSREKSQEEGTVLVIVDTRSCKVIQPKPIFTVNVNLVSEILLQRRDIMDEYNLCDMNIYETIKLKELPQFLKDQENLMVLSEDYYFEKNKAKVFGQKIDAINDSICRLSKKIEDQERVLSSIKELYFSKTVLYSKMKVRLAKFSLKRYRVSFKPYARIIKIDPNMSTRYYHSVLRNLKTRKDKEDLVELYREAKKEEGKLISLKCELNSLNNRIELSRTPIANKIPSLVCRDVFDNSALQELNSLKELEKLEKISKDYGVLPYKCPIPPFSLMKVFKNLEQIDIFNFNEPFHYSKDGENDWIGFQELFKETIKDPNNVINSKYTPLSRLSKNFKPVLDLFGVGWKEYKEVPIFMEKEKREWKKVSNVPPPQRGYPIWFKDIIDMEIDLARDGVEVMPNLKQIEKTTHHPMDNLSQVVCTTVMEKFLMTNNAKTISIIENFYNRVGGVLSSLDIYETDKKVGKFQGKNNVIIFNKLQYIGYENNERNTYSTGFFWRGPSHARIPSDRTNLFMLIFFKGFNDIYKKMFPSTTFGKCFSQNYEFCYGIKRVCVKRVDPTFYAFISNSIFEPMNSLGEEILQQHFQTGFYQLNNPLIGCEGWINIVIRRIAENCIIGSNFGNFDEGLMPFIRYEFLNHISRSNNEKCFVLDTESYFRKLSKEYSWAGISKVYCSKLLALKK